MGILFIGEKFVLDIEFVTVKQLRAMAFLTGITGRTQTMYGSFNRSGIGLGHDRNQLPGPRQLSFNEPLGSGTDMALHTLHPRVGRIHIGRIFRLHYRVAELAAEFIGFGIVITGVGEQDDHKDIDKGQTGGQKYEFPDLDEIFRYRQFVAEVFMGEYAHILLALKEKEPEKNQYESDNKGRGNEHVEHKTEILIVDEAEEFEENSGQQDGK